MADRSRLWRRLSSTVGVVVGSLAYVLTLLAWSWQPTRTGTESRYASDFFDVQAQAFLNGDIHLPPGSMGIEGFIHDGQEFQYFGPFPALLRVPVFAVTDGLKGELTVFSMLLAYVLMVVMTLRLFWLVRDLLRHGAPVGRFEAVVSGTFLALALGGTTLTFDASLPWAFHEVYAWAVPLSIAALYWLLRVLVQPTRPAASWLFVTLLALALTRTTGGWAMCGGAVLAGLWMLTGRLHVSRRWGWVLLGVGLAPVLVAAAYNYAKFDHPYMFPLQEQVFTRISPQRQLALEVNGGSITGLQFLPSTLVSYFDPLGIRFVDYFPFVTMPEHAARAYAGATLDQSYRSGSVTAFMPALVLLTLAAMVLLLGRRSLERRLLRVPMIAALVVPAGVLNYGYIAFRYTSEFVPLLVLGGMVATVVLVDRVVERGPALRAALAGGLATGTAYSVAAMLLVGFTASATTSAGPELNRYVDTQISVSGSRLAPLVDEGEGLPPVPAGPDRLYIQGDCDALYYSTGATADHWMLVERRQAIVRVEVPPRATAGRVPIADIETDPDREVLLETSGDGRARVLLRDENGFFAAPWFDVLPPYRVNVGVTDLTGFGWVEVWSTPGGWAGYLRSTYRDDDLDNLPVDITTLQPSRAARPLARHVLTERGESLPPRICERLRTEVLGEAEAAR
ncbi:hypothetical protein [Nocardioides zeicaulis]|uniref:Glycosyltransferase RgtA/B/C/D-like domain-containing protein n=1 Tax=Nocardioides zeicaulis TaxID=1776857 RepID=A0ABV6E713_9ACTN